MTFRTATFPFLLSKKSKIMTALNPVIVPAKVLKGGKHKIRIGVSHNGSTRYIVTDIIIDSAAEFRNGQVVRRGDAAAKNVKLRMLMQKYQGIIDGMDFTNCLTCSELVKAVLSKDHEESITVRQVFDEMMEVGIRKESSRIVTIRAFRCISRVLDTSKMVKMVTRHDVMTAVALMKKAGLSDGTITNRTRLLLSVIHYAQRCGYATFPPFAFDGIDMPKASIRDSWITVDELRTLRDAKLSRPTAQIRDVFMLSFYLGGMNIADLAKIDFSKFKGKLKYERTKTERTKKANKFVEFDIPDEAAVIIDRLSVNGTIRVSGRTVSPDMIQYHISKLRSMLGIENLVFYSARKTFSQIAFTLGISTSVIDYILGHSLGSNRGSCLYHYISVTPDMATDAIRKVLDFVK